MEKLSPNFLFPSVPTLYFKSTTILCECGTRLLVKKTYTRTVVSLAIGEFKAHVSQLACPNCQETVESDELRLIVPPHGKFAFDVIVYIGMAFFTRYLNRALIQRELEKKNIHISLREIDYLGKKFIVYLALAHKESQEELKRFMCSQGGYILHLDGTCEGDSPHLITTIDELSQLVLGNIKIPSENSAQITDFLKAIKTAYGKPIALVHDMGSAIINAVESVFPGVPDYICHFHFLKDIGNDLFSHENSTLARHTRGHKVRNQLRKMERHLRHMIDSDQSLSSCLNEYLSSEKKGIGMTELLPIVTAYLIVTWILESKSLSHGFGFPFDRPHLDFYLRLEEAYPNLRQVKSMLPQMGAVMSLSSLQKTLADKALSHTASMMRQKIEVFDQLRDSMRIALPESQQGLNDEGDSDMKTIEARLTAFRHSDSINKLAATHVGYHKMVQQIEKYWDKLFADPIELATPDGPIVIQPQRTNNLMEQFFRELKRTGRKKNGASSLNRTLVSMMADTPLVKNLKNRHYFEIILEGKKNLAERFAAINHGLVCKTLEEEQKAIQKYPKHMAKLFKIPHLPSKIMGQTSKAIAF